MQCSYPLSLTTTTAPMPPVNFSGFGAVLLQRAYAANLSRGLVASVAIAVSVIFTGCRDQSEEPLNWKQAKATLSDPDVVTVRDLFKRFSELPIRKVTKDRYADVNEQEKDFSSLEEHIEYGPDEKVLPDTRRAVAQRMIHKSKRLSANDITRVYGIQTGHPTKIHDAANWGNHVYFCVFTNDAGEIIGWYKVN